jgi:mono/diheme cytochrome c family protein
MLVTMRQAAIAALLAGLVLVQAACDSRAKVDSLTPPPASRETNVQSSLTPAGNVTTQLASSDSSAVEDGRSLFLANCIGCHGRNADGNTASGKAWRVPDLRAAQVQSRNDQQLLQIMRSGKGRMPGWNGILAESDLQHLLAYIRSLKK